MVLPKVMRLKGYKCFNYIHKYSKRYRGKLMVLKVVKAQEYLIHDNSKSPHYSSCKCAISISNKVSKRAVIRNRLRRLLHDHLRVKLFNNSKSSNYWALISLNTNCLSKNSKDLLEECDNLFFEAGFYR